MKKTTMALLSGAAVCAMSAGLLAGCAPQTETQEASGDVFATEAYAYEGEYTAYNPEAEAEVTGGAAIEGSEEEQLQQERIAGGAVGAVVSKNLEPLPEDSITEGDPGEYSGDLGMYGQPPARHEFDTGCLSCHDPSQRTSDEATLEGTTVKNMPSSHLHSNLTEEDCLSCHTEQGAFE